MEAVRTESVIKTVADRHDGKKTNEPADKQESFSGPRRYDKENEMENGKNAEASCDNQSLRQGEIDLSRTTAIPRHKPYEHAVRDIPATGKRTNDSFPSRTYETGPFVANDKGYSDFRSSASYPSFTEGMSSFTTEKADASRAVSVSAPSSMPHLTPIAPRVSNSSPFTIHHSADVEHRHSPSFNGRKPQTYAPYYTSNSGPLSGNVPARGASPYERPFFRDKLESDYSWRTKTSVWQEFDKDKATEDGEKQTRNYYLQQPSWDQQPQSMPILTKATNFGGRSEQPRTANGMLDKANGGKELEDAQAVARDSARESSTSPDRTQLVSKEPPKNGSGSFPLRKEGDQSEYSTISFSGANQDQHPGNHGKNENFRYKLNDDRKGSLQTEGVVVRDKQGARYVVSVREEAARRHSLPESSKCVAKVKLRDNVVTVDGAVEKKETTFYPATRSDVRSKQSSGRDSKDCTDKEETGARASESHSRFKFNNYEHRTGDARRPPASRDETKKNNDRNNNASLGTYSYFGLYGSSPQPNGELQAREREQGRYVGHGTFSQEKLFVPPNATLEMYEKREQELKADQFRAKERPAPSSLSTEEQSMRRERSAVAKGENDAKEGKRVAQGREEVNGGLKGKQKLDGLENENAGKCEEISSDEEESATSDSDTTGKRSNSKPSQSSNRLPAAPSTVKHSRLSSPVSDRNGTVLANIYGSAFGANFPARRVVEDSDVVKREAGPETSLSSATALGYPGAANLWRMGIEGATVS